MSETNKRVKNDNKKELRNPLREVYKCSNLTRKIHYKVVQLRWLANCLLDANYMQITVKTQQKPRLSSPPTLAKTATHD